MPRAKADRSRRAGRGRSRAAVKSAPAGADNSRGTTAGFRLDELDQLIQLVQRTGIGELEVTAGGRTVRIAAHVGMAPTVAVSTGAPAPAAPAMPAASGAAESAVGEHLVAIVSPMVGTFYRAPAPDADPYVEMGDLVDVGQTVCIVEAMKLMNEIESEVKGRVVRILVENAQPVEYGQKLFLIEP
jgi:acetyl-CoA carboxylase biotin carboxyl carrier protein